MTGYIDYVGEATLTVQIGQQFHIFPYSPDQAGDYAVMLLETPDFPGIGHEESHNLTVLCAAQYATTYGKSGSEERWGWVHLDAETKAMIGQALGRINATPGKWYYMLVTGGYGHRSVEHVAKIHGETE